MIATTPPLRWPILAALAAIALAPADQVAEDCRFEQTWSAGDQHYNERFVFDEDGSGRWSEGGFAGDAPQRSARIRWSRNSATLTVEADGASRTVAYELWRRDRHCYLRFAEHPILTDDSGFTLFSDGD